MTAAAAMVQRFLELGVVEIEKQVQDVAARLLAGARELGIDIVTPLPAHQRAGIVSISLPQPQEVVQELQRRGIIVAEREGVVRISPHCVNTPSEADEVVANLAEISGR